MVSKSVSIVHYSIVPDGLTRTGRVNRLTLLSY